jgi:hypothetical protein
MADNRDRDKKKPVENRGTSSILGTVLATLATGAAIGAAAYLGYEVIKI